MIRDMSWKEHLEILGKVVMIMAVITGATILCCWAIMWAVVTGVGWYS